MSIGNPYLRSKLQEPKKHNSWFSYWTQQVGPSNLQAVLVPSYICLSNVSIWNLVFPSQRHLQQAYWVTKQPKFPMLHQLYPHLFQNHQLTTSYNQKIIGLFCFKPNIFQNPWANHPTIGRQAARCWSTAPNAPSPPSPANCRVSALRTWRSRRGRRWRAGGRGSPYGNKKKTVGKNMDHLGGCLRPKLVGV